MLYQKMDNTGELFTDDACTIRATVLDMQKESDKEGNFKITVITNNN